MKSYSDLVLFIFVTDLRSGAILALQRATHATLHVLARDLAGLGLNSSETNVLAVLADGRPRAVGELAAATATRPTTLTSVLDRLAGRGLVVRELDPADRRSFVVELPARAGTRRRPWTGRSGGWSGRLCRGSARPSWPGSAPC